ncbi:MAG TPA: DUF2306 domain-containing protein [Candidatus Acidoferrum sp.]|nr:DUF2306 domain-containing protein [Candidatus Acidoferrum sp.]
MGVLSPTTMQAANALGAQRPGRWAVARWVICALLCAGVVGVASQYYFHRPSGHFGEHYALLLTHIIGGSVALLAGPWQFSRRLRRRNLTLHRWLGKIYLLGVLVGSLAGFASALHSEGGLVTHFGFGILAVLWFFTGLVAYRYARAGRIEEHRQWMIRNFSLSLAAVTLRQYLPFALFVMHWPFLSAYVAISWLCWVPNLILAEWIIRRRWAVAAI